MKFNREILKGHLTVIVLAVLADGPCHAYALSRRIQDKSLGVFDFGEGTVYPTLRKMENEGLIEPRWVERETGPKIKEFSLTAKGDKLLAERKREWRYFSNAMAMVLQNSNS